MRPSLGFRCSRISYILTTCPYLDDLEFGIFDAGDQWRNWQEGKGANRPPGKLNVKTGPPLLNILIFRMLYFVVFCVFWGVFVFLSSMDDGHLRHPDMHYHFLTFFWILASGSPTVTSGPPSAKLCPSWLKPLVAPLQVILGAKLLRLLSCFCLRECIYRN